MVDFLWNDSYSVNNDEIDTHHKKLFSLFAEVAKLVDQDKDTPDFSSLRVISELNVYSVFHFNEEEKLMQAGEYPELEEHKLLHKEFIDKIQKFKDDYMKSDPLVNYEMFNFLSDWIVKHILEVDSRYSDYI